MKLKELLDFNEIVIQCHDFPDADTIASGYGVYCYLKANGRNPRLIYSGSQKITKPNILMMIKRLEIPVEHVKKLNVPQLIITVDCVNGERNVTTFKAEKYAAIDHHINTKKDTAHAEIRQNYGSCSTIVAEMLKEEGLDIKKDIRLATALYYGLYTDTNGFAGITHPADRDLRDLAVYDKLLISNLVNSNLSMPELKIAGKALNNVKCIPEKRCAIAVAQPCDPNILGFINDLVLQVDNVDVSVVCCRVPNGLKLSVRSCINEFPAPELVKYITKGIGSGGGHKKKAAGLIYAELTSNVDFDNPTQYLTEKIFSYYNSFDVMYAKEFEFDMSAMSEYRNLPEKVGYIKMSDIVPAGSSVILRTIEADMEILTNDDMYIIIEKSGNAFIVGTQKFKDDFTLSDESFEISAEYNPTMITDSARTFDIIPFAKCCVTNNDVPIYAAEIPRTLKLYTLWDSANYMLGEKGDYLAVQADNLKDIFIINKDHFNEYYKPVTEKHADL